jgi:RHS repeat-associated protein
VPASHDRDATFGRDNCSWGTAAYTWQLDGNLATRTWGSAAIAGAYTYDGAKRPTGLYIRLGGAVSASVLARTYDAAGNVTSETQNLAGVSGSGNTALAGSGTETFSYDAANRLVASGFGAPGAQTETRTYTYDPDSNRTRVTESGVTFYYFYDHTDALVTKNSTNTAPTPGTACATLGFCYDAFGDLTTSSPSTPDSSALIATTSSYDPAGHLTAITGTSADAVSFTIDALGRHASQAVGSNPTSTYSYLGTSDSITTIASTAGTTYSTIDAIGDRLCTGVGSAIGWIVPDLHGNVAAAVSSGSAPAFVNAFRFDPYGETVANWTAGSGSVSLPWRYQGRILESAGSSTSSDLYDFAARSYDPSLGAFTSFDSVAGSAQNPATLNRYLYAGANPATLVDPDGHCVEDACVIEGGTAIYLLAIATVTLYSFAVAQTSPEVRAAEGNAVGYGLQNISQGVVTAAIVGLTAWDVGTTSIRRFFEPPRVWKKIGDLKKLKLPSQPDADDPHTPGNGPLRNLPPWIPKNIAKLLTLGAAVITTIGGPILCALGETGDYQCNRSSRPRPTPTATPTSTPSSMQPWIPSPTVKPKTLWPSTTPNSSSSATPSMTFYSSARARVL